MRVHCYSLKIFIGKEVDIYFVNKIQSRNKKQENGGIQGKMQEMDGNMCP